MKKTTKLVLMSVLTIALCVSLIAGATFALFTDDDSVNITVSSGKVDVVAKVKSVDTYSYDDPDEDGTYTQEPMAKGKFIYGTADIDDDGNLELNDMVPGDKAVVTIELTNNSSVEIQYRTLVMVAADNGLFSGLTVTIGNSSYTGGFTAASGWTKIAKEASISDVKVEIELPYLTEAQNKYQDKKCTITYTVEAVQGNAQVEDVASGNYGIFTVSDLNALADMVAAGDTAGKTFELGGDLDLGGKAMAPIGSSNAPFMGNFDGHGNTISNVIIADESEMFTGLFGIVDAGENDVTIKNLVVENIEINNNYIENDVYDGKSGGLIGRIYDGNVTVENVVLSGTVSSPKTASGFVGYTQGESADDAINLVIKDCVNNIDVSAPKATGFVAQVHNYTTSVTIENCVNNGTLTMPEVSVDNPDIVMGGFIGYVQNTSGVTINLTDCINNGDIDVNIDIAVNKLNVGGISSGARSVHYYTNVINNGNITITDKYYTSRNAEVGGLIGSPSGSIELHHVESNGDITVNSTHKREYSVGGFIGHNDKDTVFSVSDYNGVRSSANLTINVTSSESAKLRVGVVSAYAQSKMIIASTDLIASVTPLSGYVYGMFGENEVYGSITNSTLVITNLEGNGVYSNGYSWDEDGNVKLNSCTVTNSEEFVDALSKVTEGATIYLVAGIYSPTDARQFGVTANNVHIVGAGMDETILDAGNITYDSHGFMIGGDNCSISNLTIKTTAEKADALKVSQINDPTKIVKNINITNVALYSESGNGLNLHGVDGATIDNVNVVEHGKCGIAMAMATDVTLKNVTTSAGGWGDIGMMYNPDSTDEVFYQSACTVEIEFKSCNFGTGFIYSERTVENDKDIIRNRDEAGDGWNYYEPLGDKAWVLTTLTF